MRVVDISTFFSDSCGGIKTYYRDKARFLPALGVECHFIVPGKAASEESFGNAVMHRLPGPPLPGNGHYRLFGSQDDVIQLLRDLDPDVVEIGSHGVLPAWVTRAVSEVRRRPAVVGFFHSDILRTMVAPLLNWLPRALENRLMDAAWGFMRRRHSLYRSTLVASRELEGALASFGIPRVQWVGLGVDVATFRPTTTPRPEGAAPKVVYAGRLAGEKGFPTLLEAWDRIHQASGATLTVAGDGPHVKALRAFAETRPSVEYVGCLQRRGDVAALFAGADLVVTPGRHETFSLSTAEAMACGTPVLAPAQGGAGELVARSGGGALFRPNDAADLAHHGIALLGLSASERRALGARGSEHVTRSFSWPVVAGRLNAAYQAALS